MQKFVSPAYPRRLPTPTLRKGGLTYEIRVRVPPNARGNRFKASHVSRSLKTRDKAEALRRLAGVYDELLSEFDAEAKTPPKLPVAPEVADCRPAATSSPIERQTAALTSTPSAVEPAPEISALDVVRRYREFIVDGERQSRKEATDAARNNISVVYDPAMLAERFKSQLQRRLDAARGEAIVRDYQDAEWYLNFLERNGIGRVANRASAARELTLAKVRALKEMLSDDVELMADAPSSATVGSVTSSAPLLSAFVTDYIAKRGSGLSAERADTIRATVRDLIEVVGDKPVNTFTAADATSLEDILLKLPPNWRKNTKNGLATLSITAAADTAAQLGLPRQSAKTIKKKWTILFGIFKHAAVKHGPIQNPFTSEALLVKDGGNANQDKTPFKATELHQLLKSDLTELWDGRLHWLTWLGVYTGARLNELCQLNAKDIRHQNGIHYIYFSPELRLKTGEDGASIRSVPIHDELIKLGFMSFVGASTDLLFPGIPQHKSGRYSDAPSKRFSYHLTKLGLKRDKLSFNSLRHTFIARLKVLAPSHSETRERLVGHTLPGVVGRYGDDFVAEANDMDLLVERNKVLQMFSLPTPSKT